MEFTFTQRCLFKARKHIRDGYNKDAAKESLAKILHVAKVVADDWKYKDIDNEYLMQYNNFETNKPEKGTLHGHTIGMCPPQLSENESNNFLHCDNQLWSKSGRKEQNQTGSNDHPTSVKEGLSTKLNIASVLFEAGLEYNKLLSHSFALASFKCSMKILESLKGHGMLCTKLLQDVVMAMIRTIHYLNNDNLPSEQHQLYMGIDSALLHVYSLDNLLEIVHIAREADPKVFNRIWMVSTIVERVEVMVNEKPCIDATLSLKAAYLIAAWRLKVLGNVTTDSECYQRLYDALRLWQVKGRSLEDTDLVRDSYAFLISTQLIQNDLAFYSSLLNELLEFYFGLCNFGCNDITIPKTISCLCCQAIEHDDVDNKVTFRMLQTVMEILRENLQVPGIDRAVVDCDWLLNHWWKIGNFYYSKRRYQEASVIYKEIRDLALTRNCFCLDGRNISQHQTLAATYAVLGFCYLGLRELKMAHYFEKALEFKQYISDEHLEVIYGSLANIFHIRAAEKIIETSGESTELHDKAEDCFRNSLQQTARPSAISFTSFAYYLFMMERYDESLQILEQAYSARNITSSIIRFDQNEEPILTDTIREMMQSTDRIVLPTVILILYLKCLIYINTGDPDIDDILLALHDHSESFNYDEINNSWDICEPSALHANTMCILGFIHKNIKQYTEAQDAFNKAIALNPHMPCILRNIEDCKSHM